MRRFTFHAAGTAVFLAVALPALAQQSPPSTPPVSANASPADKALTQANDQMYQGQMGLLSGDADQDFVAFQLQHDKGDLALAKAELQYGQDPQLREAAQRLVTRQTNNIKTIQAWQKAHPLAPKSKAPPLAQ